MTHRIAILLALLALPSTIQARALPDSAAHWRTHSGLIAIFPVIVIVDPDDETGGISKPKPPMQPPRRIAPREIVAAELAALRAWWFRW